MPKNKPAKKGLTVADLERQVAEQMAELMEQDGIQWVKRWASPRPACNGVTGHVYTGGNVLTTAIWMMCHDSQDPRFVPRSHLFNTPDPLGKVRKGEKGCPIVYYGSAKKEDEDTGKERHIRFGKIYYVWNVSQLDDVDEARLVPLSDMPLPQEAPARDAAVDAYVAATKAKLRHGGAEAFYHPLTDSITMPPRETFIAADLYYGTLLHELVHWTGAGHRLDRDKAYHTVQGRAFEEMIAEIGSVIAGIQLGIQPAPRADNAAYVKSWISKIRERPRVLFEATSAASAAVQFMNNMQPSTMEKAA